MLNKAEQRAAQEQVDLSDIENIALDEMFSQGRPALAGIDLDSQYLFQLDVSSSRSGDAWDESLGKLRGDQGPRPKWVVKDAGSGLRAGVRTCWPGIEEHDDLFHAVYMMGTEAFYLERRAYGAITKVDELVHRLTRAKTRAKRSSLTELLQQARESMEGAVDRYDRFEALRREAVRVRQELRDATRCRRLFHDDAQTGAHEQLLEDLPSLSRQEPGRQHRVQTGLLSSWLGNDPSCRRWLLPNPLRPRGSTP